MKMILLLLTVLAASAQEPPKFIWKTTRVRVPVTDGVPPIQRHMDVIDRNEDGALVRLYRVENKFSEITRSVREIRIDGETVFVRGMNNGVGTAVKETLIYKINEDVKLKGTVYHVYTLTPPNTEWKVADNDVQETNPLWEQWAAKERAKRANEKTGRIVSYQIQQAEKGLPSFQLELGRRYLNGDGVETNRSLALHWLQAACTNGESQASNLLSKLKQN